VGIEANIEEIDQTLDFVFGEDAVEVTVCFLPELCVCVCVWWVGMRKEEGGWIVCICLKTRESLSARVPARLRLPICFSPKLTLRKYLASASLNVSFAFPISASNTPLNLTHFVSVGNTMSNASSVALPE